MTIESADLSRAYKGSYYTILGAGGDLQEWVDGYGKLLQEAGIQGTPEWFQSTGAKVNEFMGDVSLSDQFHPDLTILMFDHSDLDTGKLAMFRIEQQDRWFDDIVDNARRRG